MKTKKGIIHAIAVCQNCGQKNESPNTARKWAYAHAKAKKHFVLVEIGCFIKYEPSNENRT